LEDLASAGPAAEPRSRARRLFFPPPSSHSFFLLPHIGLGALAKVVGGLEHPPPPAPTLCSRSDDSCASSRVHLTDRSPVTAGLRFRFTGPVAPVTGRNRSNSNLNSKNSVQPVRTGLPVGLTGLPTGLNSNPNLKSHV